jgi:hypothetical protein
MARARRLRVTALVTDRIENGDIPRFGRRLFEFGALDAAAR